MPELPEVETIRRDLVKKVTHKKVTLIKVKKKKIIRGNLPNFKKVLTGSSFKNIIRVGKLLIFVIKNSRYYLLVHLKMTGQLVYLEESKVIAGGHSWKNMSLELPNKYTHVIFELKDKSRLFFNDMRQFGYLRVVDKGEKDRIIASFGIEPLKKDFTFINFKQILQGRKAAIKTVLINQKLIAGIGNIYADEICFFAQIKPTRKTNRLTAKEIRRIYLSCNAVIKKAIKKRGTTFSDYIDGKGGRGNFTKYLKVYHREGDKCLRCKKGIIKKIKLNGRGTRYCPNCQK